MGRMSEQTPEAPQRVALRYTGSVPIRVADSANMNPPVAEPGGVVVVDAWAADILTTGDAWDPAAGKALDDALEVAGLSRSGTADDKRARIAEHEAQAAAQLADQLAAEQPDTTDRNDDDTPES